MFFESRNSSHLPLDYFLAYKWFFIASEVVSCSDLFVILNFSINICEPKQHTFIYWYQCSVFPFTEHRTPNRLRMLLLTVAPMHSFISFVFFLVLFCAFLLNNNKINFSHFATLLVTHKNWVKFNSVFIMLYFLFSVLFSSFIHHPVSVSVCICLF